MASASHAPPVGERQKLGGSPAAATIEPVAEGVWVVRGDVPRRMNVYLIEDEGGVTVFDAGVKSMARWIEAAAKRFGGVKRVVLGHGHADHRGAAPGLGAPVYCHPAEKADAEGDGGLHYMHFEELPRFTRGGPVRFAMPKLLKLWDGGPVQIAGTVEEGEEVAGFRVVHVPGHAPGLIALYRDSDRLALVSDTFYTLDVTTGHWGGPRIPHRAYDQDYEQARASIRKLAALEPAAAWPGHANPVMGDVRAQLERAAASS